MFNMLSFELEYLLECVTYLGQSSVVVRARAIPHSGLRCCVSVLFECTSNADSCIPTEEWRTVLAEQVTFLLSQQDLIHPTICAERSLTFNPRLFLRSLFRLSLFLALFLLIAIYFTQTYSNNPSPSFLAREITEALAKVSENTHRAEIAIEEFIDSAG